MGESTVIVTDLVKRYPRQDADAVAGLSFEVSPGEIFGLLGPNGAGKSTTIGVLTTRVRPTAGSVRVAGVDVVAEPARARQLLAVVPQLGNLDRSLTPRQNLLFHAAYHGVPRAVRKERAARLLDEFGLEARADGKLDQFSGGMAQRVMIARALMHEPRILFLDEPTAGLDPQSRLFLWERVRQLRGRGLTVVLTTHDMAEAEEMSDRVGIVDHGKLLALGTPAELGRSTTAQSTLDITVTGPDGELCEALATVPGVESSTKIKNNQFRLYLKTEAPGVLSPVAELVAARGAALAGVQVGRSSLEDVFIGLTGRGLR
ncbi:ABC transporter ATP-binding protein [Longispora albida]|uniref:ABC transporter ATP-binding protein n=1 Tax=Longispora albida TaxID=203523 RepID=UPI000361A598|nr:ABC transporter ATP-binding protein [Longispora albida]